MAAETHDNKADEENGKEQAPLEKSSRMTKWLTIAVMATVLGSPAQFGYNMGVINAPETTIRAFYADLYQKSYDEEIIPETLDLAWSVTVAVYAVGGMIGSASAGFFADLLGRKRALLCNNAFAITAGVMMILAKQMPNYACLVSLMVAARIVVGINAGANTIIAPMYVAEISPVDLRGSLGTLFQFGVVLALLVAQILGLPAILGNDWGWNILLGLTIAPALFQLAVLSICPESPRYMLINKRDREAAKEGIKRLRDTDDVESDLDQLEQEYQLESKEKKFSVRELVTSYNFREPLMIALTLQIAQQLSGINAVNFYSTSIFREAQLSETNSRIATVGTGASQLLMIMPTIFLMDRLGRRTLMLFGMGGMCVCSGLVVLFTLLTRTGYDYFMWLNLVAVFGIMGSFSIAPGPVPWLITAELFNQGPRAAAMSLAGATNWIMTFLVGLAFQHVLHLLGDYTFLVFMALDYLFWLFVFMKVPETKNRSIDEIVETFNQRAEKRRGGAPANKAIYVGGGDEKQQNGEQGEGAIQSTEA